MRLLLDECLPRGLRRDLPGHEISTVQEMGWAGVQNGALIRLAAEAGFAALLTVDRGIEFQQSVARLAVCVVALRAMSNDIDDLRPLMPQVEVVLRHLSPGSIIRIPANPRRVQEEVRAEYDFRGGVRGTYAARLTEGTNLVLLAPDDHRLTIDG